jgi:tyrosyl-tRNA synthetase
MNSNEKFELIKRNTIEILGLEDLQKLIEGKKKPSVYLGTAITGSPHVAYFLWVNKLADFAKAGFKVKILLADLHGALDNTPWDVLEKRYKYYEAVIPLLFESLGVSTKSLEFVKGSSFQMSKDYFYDLLKLSTLVSVHDSNKAASEVVKLGDNPKLGGLIYPLMQALDEEYLGVDVQYGGNDQRKIFVLAGENLPKIGYKKRVHVMTPIVPGLIGKKMSSSIPGSKIDLMDDEESVKKKINNADCVEGNADNGLMAFMRNVVFVVKKDIKEEVIVERPVKFGGTVHYKSYDQMEKDFVEKKLHPMDLKNTVAREINSLLLPIRKNREKLLKLWKNAYS